MGERGYSELKKTEAASKLNERFATRYFVVKINEGGRKLVHRELRVIAWPIGLSEHQFQLDAESLAALKAGSRSKRDDDTGDRVGAEGEFDIFFRIVRWWDLRHWLNHPSREIRYALYVAIFAACLEYSGDLLELLM